MHGGFLSGESPAAAQNLQRARKHFSLTSALRMLIYSAARLFPSSFKITGSRKGLVVHDTGGGSFQSAIRGEENENKFLAPAEPADFSRQ
jgi:hypothetical protein